MRRILLERNMRIDAVLELMKRDIQRYLSIYNQLVTLKNRYQNGFLQIEVQLKRRYDLIPNLIETSKGHLSHELETLEAVISARNEAMAVLKAASACRNMMGWAFW